MATTISMACPSMPWQFAVPARRADILTYLLEQPHELVGEIVQWLNLKDLLNLRMTSRRLHQLVHSHEKEICARYYGRLRREHAGLQLPATLCGLPHDLLYYIELQHRYEALHQLSFAFSHHITMNLRFKSAFPTKETECRWREGKVVRLHRHLFPWLFALNGFLESLRRVFIQGEQYFANLSDEVYLSLKDVYGFDQQHIIEAVYSWSVQSIVNITAALQIFIGIASAHGLSLESKAPKYPFASVKRILIFRGLMPFKDILFCDRHDPAIGTTCTGISQRRELIAASERVLNDGRPRPIVDLKPPLPSIHHLFHSGQLQQPSVAVASVEEQQQQQQQLSRGAIVKNEFVDRQDLWYRAAHAVLQRKDGHQPFPPNVDEWVRNILKDPDDPPFKLKSSWTKAN